MSSSNPPSPPGPSQSFNIAYTGLVDYDPTTGNLLVRGNLPLLQGTSPYYFDADDLNTAIQNLTTKASIAAGFELSAYELLVISLLDNQGDSTDLSIEVGDFNGDFSALPTTWPTYGPPWGSANPPWNPTTSIGNGTIQTNASWTQNGTLLWWPFDPGYNELRSGFQFDSLIHHAHTQLVTASPKTVIYVHCDSGVNRTGAFTIAYLMHHGSSLYPMMSSNLGNLGYAIATCGSMPQAQLPNVDFYAMLSAYAALLM